jgi:hypothetical protein
VAEWILLDAVMPSTFHPPEKSESLSQTPATCANIGLHNIYPNRIDLLVCSHVFFIAGPHSTQPGATRYPVPISEGTHLVCAARAHLHCNSFFLFQQHSPSPPAPLVRLSPPPSPTRALSLSPTGPFSTQLPPIYTSPRTDSRVRSSSNSGTSGESEGEGRPRRVRHTYCIVSTFRWCTSF